MRKSRLPGSNSLPNVPEGYEVTSEYSISTLNVEYSYSSFPTVTVVDYISPLLPYIYIFTPIMTCRFAFIDIIVPINVSTFFPLTGGCSECLSAF